MVLVGGKAIGAEMLYRVHMLRVHRAASSSMWLWQTRHVSLQMGLIASIHVLFLHHLALFLRRRRRRQKRAHDPAPPRSIHGRI